MDNTRYQYITCCIRLYCNTLLIGILMVYIIWYTNQWFILLFVYSHYHYWVRCLLFLKLIRITWYWKIISINYFIISYNSSLLLITLYNVCIEGLALLHVHVLSLNVCIILHIPLMCFPLSHTIPVYINIYIYMSLIVLVCSIYVPCGVV